MCTGSVARSPALGPLNRKVVAGFNRYWTLIRTRKAYPGRLDHRSCLSIPYLKNPSIMIFHRTCTDHQPSRSELRKQFCNITRSSTEVATHFLENNQWDVSRAAHAFFDDASKTLDAIPSEALVHLFDKYKDPQNEAMLLIDGTLDYLNDLEIEPEDCRSLTLAFLLDSPQTGEFTRKSFLTFWALECITSLAEMRALILKCHSSIMKSPTEFEKFYQYCFNFIRGSDSRIKSITHEDAVSYWNLLFGECAYLEPCSERLKQWYEFVGSSKRPVSRDTWVMFYKFLIEVISKDPALLSGYDEMSSWPSMVDEFIEWLYEHGHLEAKSED
ncbi:DUF298-domain-containing protein [Metschnikowia bicuspidata var. bicuspidata NRRL YB-4993]|uniref:Defective in cullin neddylation protein n=1 Tax=Metschnikowia bicuspidata var. bicuspidata NRRL YB-4993 TaxID=869754 RepID=A0A1A0H6Z5_9ASCO|nr:DUF298-domain-containing protein [Metschnikowia bicuspidata var. bicuspidata NRRL YB-4993]OBA19677.1 DUF298-domain-containing protein [Metschnikowia bicuspidata var. bicuspidata NRRL YB-4993]